MFRDKTVVIVFFLSPLKRPFPAPATDKPFCLFVFVLGWRSKYQVQTLGLWSVREQGFIWHLHPTILITSASHSDKSDWQAAQRYIYSRYAVNVRQQIQVLKQRCFVLLKDKTTVVLMESQASSLRYWWVIWLISAIPERHTHRSVHTFYTHRWRGLINFSVCQKGGWTGLRELEVEDGGGGSPTGSDLMSKKTCACFCAVSFLLCSDRDFLSPVGMDTGVIRPSIPPTPTHTGLTEISFCCHAIPAKNPSNSLDIGANGHKECVRVCM